MTFFFAATSLVHADDPDPAALPFATDTPRSYPSFAQVGGKTTFNFDDGETRITTQNQPIPIPPVFLSEKKLCLRVTDEPSVYAGKAKGTRLYIINPEPKEYTFTSISALLDIHLEALDAQSRWRRIAPEHSPVCGNAISTSYLPSGQAWQLNAPQYTGPFKTKLRFALDNSTTLYSNEFHGSIDPALYTRDPATLKPVETSHLGFHTIEPISKPIFTPPSITAPKDALALILSDQSDIYQHEFSGKILYLSNTTGDIVPIATHNGALTLHIEFKDPQGRWQAFKRNIKQPDTSSVKLTDLYSGQSIPICVPKLVASRYRYDITTPVQCRYVLTRNSIAKSLNTIYSNEFTLNPAPSN